MENPLSQEIKKSLHRGAVIPAHPLALNADRKLDEYKQRRLTRYYLAAGAGGLAVGVHTTQFEIRNPGTNLYSKVLDLAAQEIDAHENKAIVKIAGICGDTDQAIHEAEIANRFGYHLGLLSNGGLNAWSEKELIKRTEKIAEIIPVFGFYLQPAVGGRYLSFDFWKDFAEIDNVHAIKVAAFNRYQTLDVIRAVCHSSRNEEIALYTGNDDNIVADLLTRYECKVNDRLISKSFVGGLLGHWAAWTHRAVQLIHEIKNNHDEKNNPGYLSLGIKITDMNAALFDTPHQFKGCIAGIHEVLRMQGLLDGIWCLNPDETLSPGQKKEIDRVIMEYPELTDDDFVKNFLLTDKP